MRVTRNEAYLPDWKQLAVFCTTGLDPAGPLWHADNSKIAKTDGQYVEIIHTNANVLGLNQPCGHSDFYPNGGDIQPGCYDAICSHSRSYQYFAETVKSRNNNMKANLCSSILEATLPFKRCTGDEYIMGTADMEKNAWVIYAYRQ